MTYVVELLTGKAYNDVLDEYIFQPLNMSASANYTALNASGAEISEGFLRQGINYTACLEDIGALASSNETAALGSTIPPSCAGTTKGIEYWTAGSGQEWGGGGNIIASGNDLVGPVMPLIPK